MVTMMRCEFYAAVNAIANNYGARATCVHAYARYLTRHYRQELVH